MSIHFPCYVVALESDPYKGISVSAAAWCLRLPFCLLATLLLLGAEYEKVALGRSDKAQKYC